MTDTPKFCKDCRHAVGPIASAKCNASLDLENREYLVQGATLDAMQYCTVMRVLKCGPEGKLWEAKE